METPKAKHNEFLNITPPWGGHIQCPLGKTVHDLIPETNENNKLPYLGALVNNDVCSFSYPIETHCTIEFLTFADRNGVRIYRRSLCMLLAKAVNDLFPDAQFSIAHSLGTGYYCNFQTNGTVGIAPDDLVQLDAHMRKLVEQDLPIERKTLSYEETCVMLEKGKHTDKLNLLRFNNPPRIVLFCIDNFYDLARGVMAPCTGVLKHFRLLQYDLGFILQFPELIDNELVLEEIKPNPQLHEIFIERKKWGETVGIETVGDLNTTVAEHNLDELIRTSEANHEKKISQLADSIAEHRERLKYILIAGPSSAGKTTFSKRLATQLRVNGLRPVTIECDNYFVDREHNPVDENGDPDFEHLEAIDHDLFNDQLKRLARGEKVELPRFNFHEGKKEYLGDFMQLDENQVVIIEGIHCLNPQLTDEIPNEEKFKIYINCLTQLRLDNNNRISTTDMRLIRRIIRDNTHRGHASRRTLELWSNVRRGEKRWIFPFQSEADITFNSSLDYELAALKPLVAPLLREVKPMHKEYAEARRLQGFLEMILSAKDTTAVPPNSLIREFIGGSIF